MPTNKRLKVDNRQKRAFCQRATLKNQLKREMMLTPLKPPNQPIRKQMSIKKIVNSTQVGCSCNKKEVFDFNAALLKWKVSKDRRIYELKKLK